MTSSLAKLLSLGSAPIGTAPVSSESLVANLGATEADALLSLLSAKNGFYAFEGALHVLADAGSEQEHGLLAWNRPDLWRGAYEGMADDAVFFAEDVFGIQFALKRRAVFTFDPETGVFEPMADGLEGWARAILQDYGVWTGHSLAHEWQRAHGALPLGSRLVPTIPFVLGGAFAVRNLHALEAAQGMRYRACIAVQIRDLPDGSRVRLQVEP